MVMYIVGSGVGWLRGEWGKVYFLGGIRSLSRWPTPPPVFSDRLTFSALGVEPLGVELAKKNDQRYPAPKTPEKSHCFRVFGRFSFGFQSGQRAANNVKCMMCQQKKFVAPRNSRKLESVFTLLLKIASTLFFEQVQPSQPMVYPKYPSSVFVREWGPHGE